MFVVLYGFVKSQNDSLVILNLQDYDKISRLHIGLFIGTNYSDYIVKTNEAASNSLVINSTARSGFGFGIVANVRINNFTDIRFVPSINFVENMLSFYTPENNLITKTTIDYKSTYLDFPLLFKLKPKRQGNHRPYLIIGGNFMYNLKKNNNSTQGIGISKTDYCIDFGIGLDNYRRYFKFSPELSFSLGLSNLKANNYSVFYHDVDKISSKVITLKLFFE